MHVYYIKKSASPDSGRSRRGYRRNPGRSPDYSQQSTNTTRTTVPQTSSSRIIRGADYSPVSMKEPTTSPPLKRKEVQDTDPILPTIPPSRKRAPRKPYQIETQKLTSSSLPTSRHDPAEHDDSSLPGHLERLAVEIWQLLKGMPPGPRFVCIAILICLSLILHILLQVFASWVNLIYLITGIIASIIVIYEFVKRSN
jgi:hypothetical protein